MAIIGGAVLTPLMGIIADESKHLAWAYAVPLIGYAVIAFYSVYRLRRAKLVS
jgi:FHS family L-fucose permease-like MFS transporter